MKQLSFLSGIQRSGSTLLTKVLNQNLDVFASSTSPLFDFVFHSVGKLEELEKTHSSAHYISKKKILWGICQNFHYQTARPVVVDKHRAWASNYDAVSKELFEDPKVILTLRPIEEVVTSFYQILHKNGTPDTVKNIYLGYVQEHVATLIESAKNRDKFLIVTYDQIVNNTRDTMIKVENYLGLSNHVYDLSNVVDKDPENDNKWGIKDLHTIRPEVKKTSLDPKSIMTATELAYLKQKTQELYKAFGL